MNKRIKKKTQKIIGTQRYINADTGEIIETTVIEKEIYTDYGWHKIWLDDLMAILDLIGGKKFNIVKYLLDNMRDSDNTVSVTYDDIEKDLKISRPTIASTMKILQETNFIKKVKNGLYMINPDIIVKGNSNKRNGLLVKYIQVGKENE